MLPLSPALRRRLCWGNAHHSWSRRCAGLAWVHKHAHSGDPDGQEVSLFHPFQDPTKAVPSPPYAVSAAVFRWAQACSLGFAPSESWGD